MSSPSTRTEYVSVLMLDRGLSSQAPSRTQNFHACQGQMTPWSSRYPSASDAPIWGHVSLIAKNAPSLRKTAIRRPCTVNARPSPSGMSPVFAIDTNSLMNSVPIRCCLPRREEGRDCHNAMRITTTCLVPRPAIFPVRPSRKSQISRSQFPTTKTARTMKNKVPQTTIRMTPSAPNCNFRHFWPLCRDRTTIPRFTARTGTVPAGQTWVVWGFHRNVLIDATPDATVNETLRVRALEGIPIDIAFPPR